MFPPESIYRAMNALTEPYPEQPVIERILAECLGNILGHLPPSYWAEERGHEYRGPTIPLYDALDNCGQAITDACLPVLYDKELVENGLLYDLRKQIFENEAHMNGLSLYGRRSKYVPAPQERDEEPRELCFLYFQDTPLLEFFNTQVPFQIPRNTFASHGIILAPPNHGKTQLLGSLIAGFLSAHERDQVGIFVLDPHGDLFAGLRDRVDPKRLITLDPDTEPPPLNFLDFGTSTEAQTLQTAYYLMSSLSGGLSDKQRGFVPYLLALLRRIPDASLDTLRILVDEKVKRADQSRFWPAMQLLPDVEREFFENVFYAGRVGDTKEAIAWRLYSALSAPTFREMFSAKKNSFDAAAAMRDRKVVLVKGSENALGEAGMPIFLQFIVSQVFLATLKRAAMPPQQRHLCLLICDEASHIFNQRTTRILTECRKWGLGFLGATQLVEQIPTEVKAAIYGATAIKIAGPVSSTDANVLAREMYTTGEFIRSMKAVERSHADFAFYVREMTNSAVRVRVPYGRLEAMPRLARATPIAGTPSPQSPPTPPAPTQQPAPASNSDELTGRVPITEPTPLVEANPEQPRPVATGPVPPVTAAPDPTAPPTLQPQQDDWRS